MALLAGKRRSNSVIVLIPIILVGFWTVRSNIGTDPVQLRQERDSLNVFVPNPSAALRVKPHAAATVEVSKTHQDIADAVPTVVGTEGWSRTRTLLGSPTSVVGGATVGAVATMAAIRSSHRKNVLSMASGAEGYPLDRRDNSGLAIAGVGFLLFWTLLMWLVGHSWLPIPFVDASAAMYFPLVATFVVGYLFIVFEEVTEVNKAATALVLGVMIWSFIGTGLNLPGEEFEKIVKETLEDVSEVVFFLLGALTIVEVMDAHKGFDIITKQITQNRSKDLLVVVSILTFFLSSVLNNLTVVIVMIALLQKVVKDDELRLKLGGIVVVVSNAGGAWTPIGDITTTMLYIGGQVTTVPLLVNLFVPSILCLIGTLGYFFVTMEDVEFERPAEPDSQSEIPGRDLVFFGGLCGMIGVPVFTALTQCPAWSGMMLVLGVLGVITYLLHGHGHDTERYTIKGALERVEVPDCLFFLGVLFAVGGLEKVGLLKEFATQLSALVSNEVIIATLLGFASAIVDNVPLVAASQGMYSLSEHGANDFLWNLICYCAATGGSLLVIGSAAGVAFLGLEKKANFGWYVSNILPGALIGYFLGIAGCVAQNGLGLVLK